jgi:hypothetical protein
VTQDRNACGRLLRGGEPDEPYDTGVRLRSHYGQLTEVLIKGENNLASVLCMGKDGGIARI